MSVKNKVARKHNIFIIMEPIISLCYICAVYKNEENPCLKEFIAK